MPLGLLTLPLSALLLLDWGPLLGWLSRCSLLSLVLPLSALL